jgi:murein DD-endopeptidase MepM/ murein hydrolase activator NlpD
MKRILKVAFLVLAGFAAAAFLVVSLRVSPAPRIDIRPKGKAIGARGAVHVVVSAPGGRGLSELRVEVEQNGHTTVVAHTDDRPLAAWAPTGARRLTRVFDVDVGRRAVRDLREGEAVVRVVAARAGTWLRRPAPVVREVRLPVRLRPPSLAVVSTQHYVAQGGSGVLVYRVGATSVRDGVRGGPWFFPGAPLPGGASGDRFAFFGVPWDRGDADALRLVAEDDAGNVAEVAFVDRFLSRPPTRDTIELNDDFLERAVTEIRQQTPDLPDRGGLLEDYLEINRDLRKANAQELVALARRSAPAVLWKEPFLPLHNAKVMSSFADQRRYFYAGREVDQQTHLGYDLAVTRRTPVPAANAGRVLLARYFGIYGNAVVIDHGFGLMTLYGHLSSIDVKEGQKVARGDVIGRTGRTGLAGGDHLHFTMLVRGLPVTPAEWWDPHWIRDRIARPLAPAIVFAGERRGRRERR